MQFFQTKFYTDSVNVLFTGPQYLFFDSFYGLIAVADRVEDFNNKICSFIVTLGNDHTDESICNDFSKVVKRVIEKAEMRIPITKFVQFDWIFNNKPIICTIQTKIIQ